MSDYANEISSPRGDRFSDSLAPLKSDDRASGLARPPVYAAIIIVAAAFGAAAAWRLLGTGPDYYEYSQAYYLINPYFSIGSSRFEPGYEFTAWLFATQLKLPFAVFYFFLATSALLLKFGLISKYCSGRMLAIASYLLIFYPLHEYTQIRAAVALAFAYWAVHFLIERRFTIFIISTFATFLFHSSVVLVPIVAVIAIFTPPRFYTPLAVVAAFIAPFYLKEITEFISYYFADYNPLVSSYIINSNNSGSINLLSGSNIINYIILSMFLAFGWLRNDDYRSVFFAMAISAYIFQILFNASPVLAVRTGEMLIMSMLFLVFRTSVNKSSSIPPLLLLASGLWTTYRAIGEGVYGS